MRLDLDKLVVLVKARPAIYDFKMKDHSDKEVIERLWNEVSRELNASASDCRMKWHILRSSYSRYLREIKKELSRSGSFKRKKWYLADAMSFLDNYINHKQTAGYIQYLEEGGEEIELLTSDKETFEDSNLNSESRSSSDSLKPSSEQQSTAELLAVPTAKFLQNLSEKTICAKERGSPLVNFFLGVLPDLETLSAKRQRVFKAELVRLVNKLADEEEEENS